MPELNWRDAITQVLQSSPEPMHYAEIAEAIAKQELRSEFGATPASTVNSIISVSLQNERDASPFIRVERGRYWLRNLANNQATQPISATTEDIDDTGLINAFGMYWSRSKILWTSAPRILGQQQPGSTPVDFANEKGVYLLHDGRAVVYVGRTTDQPLSARLKQHTVDRLNGRWDRFSWFGVYPVTENGMLNLGTVTYDLTMLIVTMEALLIEGLEPPQNRKRGDDFRAVEFLQVEDPTLEKQQILNLMDALKQKL